MLASALYIGGGSVGQATWSYPSLWPGLHASHSSPAPDRPGELIGTTRLLGELFTPQPDVISKSVLRPYLFTVVHDVSFLIPDFLQQRIL